MLYQVRSDDGTNWVELLKDLPEMDKAKFVLRLSTSWCDVCVTVRGRGETVNQESDESLGRRLPRLVTTSGSSDQQVSRRQLGLKLPPHESWGTGAPFVQLWRRPFKIHRTN